MIEDLGLIIYTLDGKEDFPKSMCMHDIQLPFCCKACTVLNEVWGNLRVRRKGGEEEDHAERVVDVPHGIYKCRIPVYAPTVEGLAVATSGKRRTAL